MTNKIDNIEIIQGDLTEMNLDIIVNAANHTLLGGGGIDGMIHRKAGPLLLEECKKLNGCEIGSAKMTDAYNLPCKKIIHACGPMYYGHREDAPDKLRSCYKRCIELAEKYRVDNKLESITIGFPCISTGIYGYPKEEACKIAIDTVREYSNIKIEVKFVCFSETDYKIYIDYLNRTRKDVFMRTNSEAFKLNKISKSDFIKLNEDDLMFITTPGRMGDVDGITFIIKHDNELIIYRVEGLMYGNNDEIYNIPLSDFEKQFPKWGSLKKDINKENNEKYKYLYMGFGNGLSIDNRIYREFEPYLNKSVEKYLDNSDSDDKESLRHAAIFKMWKDAFINMVNDKSTNS